MAKVPEIIENKAIDGERPMSIVRRMGRERERMLGMTDEERAWRKKWLKAQELAPEEPVIPKDYYKKMYNPIRRFYMAPMNKFQNMLETIIGYEAAFVTRRVTFGLAMGIVAVYWTFYHLKYHKMDWTRNGGWKVTVTRPAMYSDNKNLELLNRVKGNQFYVNNFDKSPI